MAVVIPAFNEERAIAAAVRAVPQFVDRVIVVDDASLDGTANILTGLRGGRVQVVSHARNRGVGAAIKSGYRLAAADGFDVVSVMAGDGQMDPADLPNLLDPIVDGQADYTKGNRFAQAEVWRVMPATRIAGNLVLSVLTKAATGYWQSFDSQCGYTAITRDTLEALDLDRLFARYGYPNDLLGRLAAIGARVCDVSVRPVYGESWRSGIRVPAVVAPIVMVLAKAWLRRHLGTHRPLRAGSKRDEPADSRARAAG